MERIYKEKINFKFNKTLFLIVIIGFLLRFWGADFYPVNFHSQEAILGWRAKSIFLTGKDETGRSYPFIFSTLEGYQLPLTTYLISPFVGILGLSPQWVMLPVAILGALAIISFYNLTKFLFPKYKNLPTLAALFLSVNPWTVYLSRRLSPVVVSFYFFIIGFYFVLKSFKSAAFQLLGIIFLSASIYTDKSSWFFTPLFLVWFYIYKKKKKFLISFIPLILSLFFIVIFYFKSPQAKVDFLNNDLSLFIEPSISTSINALRGEDLKNGLNPILSRLLHNKLFYLQKILGNFLAHFNPRFYFISGDQNPRHGLTNFGPILLIFIFPTLIGIEKMFKKEKLAFLFLLGWLIIGIMPSVFLFYSPDQERTVFILPVLAIFASYGLKEIKKKWKYFFWALLVFNFLIVGYDGLIKDPWRFPEKNNLGYKDLAFYIKKNLGKYQNIYLTDVYGSNPAPAILFYLDYSPQEFFKSQANKGSLIYRYWINNIGEVIIDQKDLWRGGKNSLYIVTSKEEDLIKKICKNQEVKKEVIKKDNLVLFISYICEDKFYEKRQ